MRNEQRFRMVEKIDPDRFERLAVAAQTFATQRVAVYEQLAKMIVPAPAGNGHDNGESSE